MPLLRALNLSLTDYLSDCVSGLSGIVWYCAWEMIVHDSPSAHPTISTAEKDFIETSIRGSSDSTEVRL